MPKKHKSGFVSVNYKIAGKAMLVLATLILIARILELFIITNYVSNIILFVGISFAIIGIYLVFIVPK